jgi:hypothetical protein
VGSRRDATLRVTGIEESKIFVSVHCRARANDVATAEIKVISNKFQSALAHE